ncbi:MAG: NAD(P)H-dependent oxidoreductase [Defluviitaleaceae bacterium]|nr:NAD(P)H-dependent oxidoreductase [Defluviitaleaceae bacterium]
MKITVIHGSMRKGNTYGVVQAVLEHLGTRGGVEITNINVADLELPFCSSCHICFSKGDEFCPHNAIVGPVVKAIEDCDGLIISGVCYAMHVNAALKNLIDHFAYLFHRPRMFSKVGMVVATTAGAGEIGVAKYLRQVLGHWGMGKAILLPMKIQVAAFSLTDKQKRQVSAAADRFYNAIRDGKLFSPSMVSVAVHNSFRAMASVAPPVSECDSAYWRESGFGDRVYPRKIGFGKAFVGRFMYLVMGRMFRG